MREKEEVLKVHPDAKALFHVRLRVWCIRENGVALSDYFQTAEAAWRDAYNRLPIKVQA